MRNKAFIRRNAFWSVATVALLAVPFANPIAADVPATSAAASAASVDDAVNTALSALGSRVSRTSHSEALRTAFRAYYNYKAARPGQVRKPYLYFVDMGLDNRTPRGYVFDMDNLSRRGRPLHGRARQRLVLRPRRRADAVLEPAGQPRDLARALPGPGDVRLQRQVGRASVFVRRSPHAAASPPASTTRHGPRGVVAHGAPYVTASRAGRSEGCPAMEVQRAARLLPMLANGGVVFVYSPNDREWLGRDPWIQGARGE